MYGEPLEPNRTGFNLEEGHSSDDYGFQLWLIDLDEPSNDDIRDVNHPEFDMYWGNASECQFLPWEENYHPESHKTFKNMKEAREWLVSIGMQDMDTGKDKSKESTISPYKKKLKHIDTFKEVSKNVDYSKMSQNNLQKALDKALDDNDFKTAAKIGPFLK